MTDVRLDPRAFLQTLFAAALDAAAPEKILPPFLPTPPRGKTFVIGAGKASAAMARAVERHWPADRPLSGLVVTRYGYGVNDLARIKIVEAAHPVPDAAGEKAAQDTVALLKNLGPDDLVLCLMSGGGSSLLALPAPGVTLADKKALTRALLACGATIHDINCVRKHLSAIKGGRLAQYVGPAALLTLAISDIPGDEFSAIASGPTVPDPTTRENALEILRRYKIDAPQAIWDRLNDPACETPKPGDRAFADYQAILIATPQQALEAAAQAARAQIIAPLILGDALEGEARELGRIMAGVARQVLRHDQPLEKPCVLLSGGETTVTLRGTGCGGRNVEFLLSLALALDGAAGVYALAADTDGVDGAAEVAGALIGPDTLLRAKKLGLDARKMLDDNDAHRFFEALGDQLITGPTRTNVNDFRAVLILPH